LQLKEWELQLPEAELQEQKADVHILSGSVRRLSECALEMSRSLSEKCQPTLRTKYGDIMKHVLPRMLTDPGELMTFLDTYENSWEVGYTRYPKV